MLLLASGPTSSSFARGFGWPRVGQLRSESPSAEHDTALLGDEDSRGAWSLVLGAWGLDDKHEDQDVDDDGDEKGFHDSCKLQGL